jgi:hypothetical protein
VDKHIPGHAETSRVITVIKDPVSRPFEARVGNIRVRSLSFSLEGEVDAADYRFIRTELEDALV